jgi:hypothetical protein
MKLLTMSLAKVNPDARRKESAEDMMAAMRQMRMKTPIGG